MADSNPTQPAAPAKITLVNPPALPFTPIAVHISVKTRAGMIQRINELNPAGKPNPALVAVAKTTALALIDTFPPEVTGIELRIDSNAGRAAQLNIIVIPHEL